MIAARRQRARAVAAVLLMAAATCVQALTLAQLQQRLQRAPIGQARYEEVRESPWLSAPVTTRGTLHVTRQALEKRVTWPRPETWRLLEDRAEWAGPDGAGRKQILYSQAPALQVLADVTRLAITADLAGLERDFDVTVQGDEGVWSAELKPRTPRVSRLVASVELQGAGARLLVLIVTERQGERTTTRILP